jgi:hypothetical protein
MMITKVLQILFLILIFLSKAFSSEVKEFPNTLEYKLDIRIDYNTRKLYGKCEITVFNGTEEPIKNIPILLYRLLAVKLVENEDNVPLSYSQEVVSISGWEEIQVNFINITLSKLLSPGEQLKIDLEYEGYLFGYSSEGWRYVKDHIDKSFTLIRTDGFGYPVIGYPSENDMMQIGKQKYDYQIKITVPEELIAVTGGKLVDRTTANNNTTYIFRNKKPSWRIDVAISDFKVLEKGENKVFYLADDSLGAQKIMKALYESYELYTSWFGPLNNFQGFSIIEVPEGYSSQQDVTAIILSAENFKNISDMRTIYHEIAHSWNVTNMEYQPCRFETEGFAQFMQFLLLEKLDKKENAVSEAAQAYLDRVRDTFKKNEEYQAIPIKDYGIHGMTDFSYTLGMVVFTLFYDLVGPEHFNKIIGSFYLNNYLAGATMDEFINHCKNLAPFNLKSFFDDWIYTTRGIEFVVEGKTFNELLQYYKDI